MKNIVFLTPGNSWPGFKLAGMDQLVLTTQNAEEHLLEQTRDPKVGLVVLDARLCAGISDERLAQLDHQYPGKVTILPPPEAGQTDFALDIIRQAIGYHVRIQG